MLKVIEVVAGVIYHNNELLLSQRGGDFMPNFWELPGGKVRAGENKTQALKRECLEELGIIVKRYQLRLTFKHHYPDRIVQLWVYDILYYQGEITNNEGQVLRFVPLKNIKQYQLLPTMKKVLQVLKLADIYWITPPQVSLAQIEEKLQSGIKQIQWRLRQNLTKKHIIFLEKVQNLCQAYKAKMFLNTKNIELKEVNLQLNSNLLKIIKQRPINDKYLLGASVHNLKQLKKAEAIGADFAVLSPVLKTASHPDIKPLGWQRAEKLIAQSNLAIYCLGGMQVADLDQAKSIGAIGIAGISQINITKSKS